MPALERRPRGTGGHALRYQAKVIAQLLESGVLSVEEGTRLGAPPRGVGGGRGARDREGGARPRRRHPTHFLFDDHRGLTMIDLERLRPADPAADLGRLAAELKHLFLLHGRGPSGGEPHIQRLYAAYASALAQGAGGFTALTTRGCFHMGSDLLRIARNSWLSLDHRRALVGEAFACLTPPD